MGTILARQATGSQKAGDVGVLGGRECRVKQVIATGLVPVINFIQLVYRLIVKRFGKHSPRIGRLGQF